MHYACRWCFTINNPTYTDCLNVVNLLHGPQTIIGCAGLEVSRSGTPHIQGFVHLNVRVRFPQMLAWLGANAHCEICWGSDAECWRYCSKDNNILASRGGPPPPPPTGATIIAAARSISAEEFVRTYPEEWLRHRVPLERIMLEVARAKAQVWTGDLHLKNVWIWGEAGVGKSRWAADQSPMTTTLKKTHDHWWDGYSLALTSGVIVENYPPAPDGDRLAAEVKHWGDRAPFQAGVKGSTILVDPGKFTLIVTSNYSIEQCFSRPQDRAAMRERFWEIAMTGENREALLQWRLDRSILRT